LFGFHVIAFADFTFVGRAETGGMQGRKTTRACKISATIPLSQVSAANAIELTLAPTTQTLCAQPAGPLGD
jgi:hypothetical protein